MPLPTLQNVHIQAALTDLSVAYRQDAPAVSDRIFPRVPVSKQADKYFIWDKADMWRREVKKRAPGADFARMGVRLSTDNYSADQYALEYPIPDEIRANQDAAVDVEATASMVLVDQHNLEKDFQFASTFFTTGVWAAGTVTTQWSTVATGTPITDIIAATSTIRQALGGSAQHRLVGLGGTKIRAALLGSAQIREAGKYVTEQSIANVDAALAALLGLDELVISDRVYNTRPEKASASYTPLFNTGFLLVAVPRNPGLMVPSAGYTFAWDEGGRGDMYVEQYRDEPKKSDVLRSICYFDQKLVGADLGVFFNNAVA
jgi:hypothetical protein